MRKDDFHKLITLATALDSLGYKEAADVLDGVLYRIAGDEKEYTYTVEMEKRHPGQEDGDEENVETETVVDNAKGTLKDVLHDAKRYNIHTPPSNPTGPDSLGDSWWRSEYHDEDRDLFEKGIKKYYSMYIGGTPEEKQTVYQFLMKELRGK